MQNTITLQQNETQRLFDNGETAKNNDVARKSEIASVTGYSPDEWVVSNNPYMNEDGTIKDQYKNVDFSAVMANAKKTGNTKAYNAAAVARYYKIMGDYGAYGKYDDGNYTVPGQQQTETGRQFDEQTKATLAALGAETDLAKYEIDTKKTMADNENATSLSIASLKATEPKLTLTQAENAIKNGEVSQVVIDAYNYYHGTNYTPLNPPKIKDDKGKTPDLLGENAGNDNDKMTDSQVKAWANELNREISEKYGSKFTAVVPTSNGNYKRGDADVDYIVTKIFGSDDLTQEQKEYLLYDKFGITEEQVKAVINDKHYK
jgi:hypothetical protein